jgi:hypothetical protein
LRLAQSRRGQLVVAVLFGAILGGGFVAAASTVSAGVGHPGPGVPMVGQFDHHRMGHFGEYGRP